MDPLERLAGHLASNLKYVREQRGLTQGQLAKLSGVPRSTIANVETGAANPTLAVLAGIAGALQLSLEELLSAPRGRTRVWKKGTLPILQRARGGKGKAIVMKLLPHPIPGMEIDRIELEPGARMAGVPHRPGTQEYLCCERGTIVLFTAGERFVVEPGDVAVFQGDQAHAYHNEGSEAAIGFSVVTLAPMPGGGA